MSLYAFNGFVIEELPHWEKDTNPNAVVVYREFGQSREILLLCSNAAMEYDPNDGIIVPEGSSFEQWILLLDGGAMTWGQTYSTGNVTTERNYPYGLVWANYGVESTAGAEIMSASDPVLFADVATDKTWVKAGREKMPEFPIWDKETYPYGYIFYAPDLDGYILLATQNAAYVDLDISTETVWTYGEFIISKYMRSYKKPYWDSFVEAFVVSDDIGISLSYSDIVWHSVINNRAGLPYYEPSPDPVPLKDFDLKTFLTFLAAGLCAPQRPLSKKDKKLVAYSYNGVILPALPDEWDVYPYATLSYQNGKDDPQTKYIFLNFSSEEYVAAGFNDILFKTDGSGRRYRFLIDGGSAWEFATDFETESIQRRNVFWTSHDILLSDGYVGLEASEPVPV